MLHSWIQNKEWIAQKLEQTREKNLFCQERRDCFPLRPKYIVISGVGGGWEYQDFGLTTIGQSFTFYSTWFKSIPWP